MYIVSLVGLKIHKNYNTKLGQGYCLDYHLLKWSEVKLFSHVWLFATPWLLCPWDFLGKSTGVGCHFLLQGIFLTQGSNPGLPHCRQMLYPLSHQGSHHLLLEAKKPQSCWFGQDFVITVKSSGQSSVTVKLVTKEVKGSLEHQAKGSVKGCLTTRFQSPLSWPGNTSRSNTLIDRIFK